MNKLTKNFGFNFLAHLLPLIFAVLFIPFLINGLGVSRFGFLSLAWMFFGYFSLFDFGISRATTKFVSELQTSKPIEVTSLVWSSWILLLLFGLIGSIFLYLLTPVLASVLKIPNSLETEILSSLKWICISVPFILYTNSFKGILEGYQLFKVSALIQIPSNISTILIPIMVLQFSNNLDVIIGALVLSRALFAFIYLYILFRLNSGFFKPQSVSYPLTIKLLKFGGWLTVTNIIGPIMTYLDRVVIGAVISIAAVSYYTTPYDFVTRLLVIPYSFLSVLFPAFSSMNQSDKVGSIKLLHRTIRIFFFISLPIVIILMVSAFDILRLWISHDFAMISAPVMRWLVLGMFINMMGLTAFTWIQADGKSKVTAIFHMVELPIYIGFIFILISRYGIIGVAISWTLRVSLDTLLLFFYLKRQHVDIDFSYSFIPIYTLVGISLYYAINTIANSLDGIVLRVTFLFITLLIFYYFLYKYFLHPTERFYLHNRVMRIIKNEHRYV